MAAEMASSQAFAKKGGLGRQRERERKGKKKDKNPLRFY